MRLLFTKNNCFPLNDKGLGGSGPRTPLVTSLVLEKTGRNSLYTCELEYSRSQVFSPEYLSILSNRRAKFACVIVI